MTAKNVRAASFNLENLDFSGADASLFARRLKVLRPVLDELAADILCLQEINAQREKPHAPRRFLALEKLLAQTPYADFHVATSRRPGSDEPADVHNLAILSRWPIVETRQLHHDIVGRWSWTPPEEGAPAVDIAFDRPLLYAKIAVPAGPPLHVLNLHLRAPRAAPVPTARGLGSSRSAALGQFLAAQKREGQALEARLFVESLFDAEPNARICVCGDFNADEHDAPTRILRGARAEDGPPAPRGLIPLEDRVEETRRFSVIHAGRKTLIDHILASPALAAHCRGAEIFNNGLEDEVGARDPVLGSLHAPLVAEFAL